jgi:hypothetical protein
LALPPIAPKLDLVIKLKIMLDMPIDSWTYDNIICYVLKIIGLGSINLKTVAVYLKRKRSYGDIR